MLSFMSYLSRLPHMLGPSVGDELARANSLLGRSEIDTVEEALRIYDALLGVEGLTTNMR